jgi:hypothetical protein
MPFKVVFIKKDNKYKLWNITKKEFAKPSFNSRQSALNAGANYIRYREKKNKPV